MGPARTPAVRIGSPLGSPTCAVEECSRPSITRGWCRRHYQRWQRYGDPTRERPSVAERIRAGSIRRNGCLEWRGARDKDGYGLIRVEGTLRRLPRVVWELHFGPIPAGLMVCHSCDNPTCADIDHLLLGTQRANIQDMLAKGRRPARREAA
jgi:hypothetical protein